MKILPIASSSDGNCVLLSSPNTDIIIDAGAILKSVKQHTGKLDAIFISHEHSDHWEHVGPLKRFYKCPVYMNEYSYNERRGRIDITEKDYIKVNPGDEVQVGNFTITHFSTKHDTKMSFGYLVKEENGPTLCYITDTGMITPLMLNYMLKSSVLFIEADYDEQLLTVYTGYEQWLKDRIKSNFGHLSNQQVLEFLKEHNIFDTVIFGHLSPRTNTPETINTLVKEAFPDTNTKFYTAPLTEAIECL